MDRKFVRRIGRRFCGRQIFHHVFATTGPQRASWLTANVRFWSAHVLLKVVVLLMRDDQSDDPVDMMVESDDAGHLIGRQSGQIDVVDLQKLIANFHPTILRFEYEYECDLNINLSSTGWVGKKLKSYLKLR